MQGEATSLYNTGLFLLTISVYVNIYNLYVHKNMFILRTTSSSLNLNCHILLFVQNNVHMTFKTAKDPHIINNQ